MQQGIGASNIIGNNIRTARKQQKLTQEQLAARLQTGGCDLSRGTLAKIEAGIRHLSAGELNAIRLALGMTYEDIFRQ